MGQPGEALQPYSGTCLACNSSVISLSDDYELVMFLLFSINPSRPDTPVAVSCFKIYENHTLLWMIRSIPSTWLSVAFAVHLYQISRGVDAAFRC